MSAINKTKFSKLLSFLLVITLIVPVTVPTAFAADSVHVDEDFSGYAPGTPIGTQNNWSYAGQSNEFMAVQDSETGSTYGTGTFHNGDKTSYIGQRFAPQSGGMVLEFDANMPSNKAAQLFVMEGSISNTSKRAARIFLDSNVIQVEGRSDQIAADPTHWYRFKIVFNIPQKQHTISVTDRNTGKKLADWTTNFSVNVGNISSFGFSLTKGGGTIHLDNVKVTQLDLALTHLQLATDKFVPKLTPDFDPRFTSYKVDVPHFVNTISVSPSASNPDGVQLTVGGVNADNGAATPVALHGTTTDINIAVTSSFYTDISKTYTLHINKLEKSPNVNFVSTEGRDAKVLLGWEETIDPYYKEANIYMIHSDGSMRLVDTVPKGSYISTVKALNNGEPYTFVVKGVYEYEGEEPIESSGVSVIETPVSLPARQMEYLDRGLVAMKSDDGVYVGWRLLGTDSDNVSFHLYRDGKKINKQPIRESTNFLDAEGTTNSTYELKVLGDGGEERKTETVKVWDTNYLSVPIQKPADGVTASGAYTYRANDATAGDLDGDGQYEIVLKWDPTNSQDNSRSGFTGNTYVDAYKLDGTRLWRINLGKNIRSGAHYTHVMVYDLDGDGKAEVTFRTADGTIDGVGNVIADANADYRNDGGYVLSGPEYFTIFEGTTGKALVTEAYEPARGNVSDWGDGYGNRVDRFGAAIAYLDGERPSVVFQRGYYTRMVFTAYNWREGQLSKLWTFDSSTPGNESYYGQGNHQLSVADVDGDGKDEIFTGAAAIDDDGTGLWSSRLGHGDAMHLGDLNPDRLGLEIFAVQEDTSVPYSNNMKDARTGRVLWGLPQIGLDVGRGLSADIDPRHKGAESWSVGGGWNSPTGVLFNAQGQLISDEIPSANFAIWWDGDLSRELLDHYWLGDPLRVGIPKIDKWNYVTNQMENVVTFHGTYSNNDTKGNPALQADLLGDWREEVIVRTEDSSALRIYSTTSVTEHRIRTLMHDPVYRLAIAWQNTGYNQPPHTGFYLGTGMETPEMPNIRTTQ
jgi:hypothetical protein